ncbi:MAG: hypothetical protein ACLFTH_04415 [Candidatus Woesearchaeota archaeon]
MMKSDSTTEKETLEKNLWKEEADKTAREMNLKGTPGEKLVKFQTKAKYLLNDPEHFKGRYGETRKCLAKTGLESYKFILAAGTQGALVHPLAKKYERITGYTAKAAERWNALFYGNLMMVVQNGSLMLGSSLLQNINEESIISVGESLYNTVGDHAILSLGYNAFRLTRNFLYKNASTLPSINILNPAFHTQYISDFINNNMIKPYKNRALTEGTNNFYGALCQLRDDTKETFNELSRKTRDYLTKTGNTLSQYCMNDR